MQEEAISRYGLTEVYNSAGYDTVDVIFVHGLHGHPYHTWACERSRVFWPAQLLPPMIVEEKARILVYGYNADVISFTDGASKDKIHNHAEQLVADLCANRQIRKATERPIVFVTHSLGGLVVKRALVYSSEIRGRNTEHLRSIFVSTFGVLFLGTPHKGCDIAIWGSQLERICDAVLSSGSVDIQSQLIDALKTNNETLQNIDRQFMHLTSRFRIYFFHEGRPTNLKGTLQFIVDEESASPNIQDVERAGIQQDHYHMCKFENETAPGFHLVVEAIQRFAHQAPEIIQKRWISEQVERRTRKEGMVEEIIPGMIKRIENKSILPDSVKAVKPLFLVPFSRDSSFIDRTEVFDEIAARTQHHRRVALSGFGGVGKSQIVIEYCYRFRDENPDAHIFWVHASTRQRFSQEFRNIAGKLQIPGWRDPNADTLDLVFEWFNEADNGRWLMILDNADDLDTFYPCSISDTATNEGTLPLHRYLPESFQGLLLITTRDERIGKRLAGRQASIVVNPMSYSEAQKLLESQMDCRTSLNIDESKTLLDALGYIPLAITQAAAFISENGITLKEYLELFTLKDSEIQSLLSEDLGDLRRDSESQNSIFRTWKISFDMISKQKPRAAEMLSLMAVLDRQGIPESLLVFDTEPKVDVMTALGTLKAFSLISAGDGGRTYELHRLVQLATRNWLEMQGTTEKWQEKAFLAVANMFPIGEFENWPMCEDLMPHAQVVLQYIDKKEIYPEYFPLLLCNVASFDNQQGRYEIAHTRSLAAFQSCTKMFGLEHPNTLGSMSLLASIYRMQGRLKDAETLGMQVMKTYLTKLKEEHPYTLNSINNLALTYHKQKQWDEAEKLQIRVMKTRLKVLKEEHPHTLSSMSNLALTYYEQKRWDEAEKLQIRVMKTSLKVFKEEHPDTMRSMNNLAQTYCEQKRWDEAEKLQIQVMKTSLKVLKEEHPDTLMCMHNLALTYYQQKRWDEAEKLLIQVMKTSLKVLKEEHPDTMRSMRNLAVIYYEQKRWDEAEKLLVQVMKTRLKVLKEEHPDTLDSMHQLACTYYRQDRHEEAIALMKKVIDLRTKALGADHPNTKNSVKFLEIFLDK